MPNYYIGGVFSIVMKNKKKKELNELIWEKYHNKGQSIEDLVTEHRRSKRTIYRWLNKAKAKLSPVPHKLKKK
jgi:transposase